jgi:hypothetical protein
MNHTPTPWRVCGGFTPEFTAIHSSAGYIIFRFADNEVDVEGTSLIKAPSYDEQRANAAHIVKCVNGYDDAAAQIKALREALEQCVAYITRQESHKGCMNLAEIKAAEADFTAHVSSLECGHHAGEGVRVDLKAARAALASTQPE